MSKWIDRFNSHPLTGVWANLMQLIQDESLDEGAAEDAVEDIARLRKVIFYLNGIYESIDPEVTPFNNLTNIQQSSQGCINEINAYKGNKNTGHLTNANNNADSLLLQFQQTPASANAASTENIKNSVSAYSKTIGSYISKYKNETEESVSNLAKRIDDLNGDINIKEAKLAELTSQIKTVEQTIQQQTTEFNTRRPQKLSATPDHFGKVLPHVLSRTQRHRARHDPDRPVQWLQPAQACPADEPQPLDGQP